MDHIIEVITNPCILAAAFSWMFSQVVKAILYAIINKKFELARLFGAGGMPSGHSATVTSLALTCGFSEGFDSSQFALALFLAIIVCHDAMGVRREAGKHARILRRLVGSSPELAEGNAKASKLKIFIGHEPLEVLAGVIVGVASAFIIYFAMT